MKVTLLALVCFATSISELAIVGMIDVVAEPAVVSVATAGQLPTAFAPGLPFSRLLVQAPP